MPNYTQAETRIEKLLGDDDPKGFLSGWWSGVLSFFFGILALGAVLCLHFPQLLSTPEMRAHYPMPLIRMVIQFVIVAAIFFGVVSAMLRRKKALGLTGMLFSLAACLFGGSSVPINEAALHAGPSLGLDWFLLDMLLMTLILSPIEVLWPAYPQQSVFRNEWTLDVVYFLSTHLPTQLTTFLILLPATQLTYLLGNQRLLALTGSLPWVVQLVLAIFVADIFQYAVHRAMHKVPWMWKFHAVHHSSKALDWIAGSRAHIVEDIAVRGFILIPFMLAFSQSIIVAYLLFVALHATWAHCNFGPRMKWLEPYVVFPRYHHWHHTSQAESIDKNFAIHFPWIDRMFGTYYHPKDAWPEHYGLDNEPIPATFIGQTLYPFTRTKRPAAP
ncbi:MAG: sterol desaturase family protein [Luteimonas sp.]